MPGIVTSDSLLARFFDVCSFLDFRCKLPPASDSSIALCSRLLSRGLAFLSVGSQRPSLQSNAPGTSLLPSVMFVPCERYRPHRK